jgi:hypothetical protein
LEVVVGVAVQALIKMAHQAVLVVEQAQTIVLLVVLELLVKVMLVVTEIVLHHIHLVVAVVRERLEERLLAHSLVLVALV